MQCIVIILLFVSGGLAVAGLFVADSSAAVPLSNITANITDCIHNSDYLRIESSLLNTEATKLAEFVSSFLSYQ